MIGLTSGRETSQRLNILLKELTAVVPNSRVVRRGKSSLQNLSARYVDGAFKHAVAIYRWHGGPGRMDFFNVTRNGIRQVPPIALLGSVVLRREFGTERGRRMINAISFEKTSTKILRLAHVLSEIFEVPPVEYSMITGCSLHVREFNESIELVVISSNRRDMGPKLVISKLLWNVSQIE